MKSRYEKLMAVANDPSATPEEREAYRKKAAAMGKPASRRARTTPWEIENADYLDAYDAAMGRDRWAPFKMPWQTYWTVVYKGDGSAPTNCCCKAAGDSSEACRDATGNKTKCRCACHPRKKRKGTK